MTMLTRWVVTKANSHLPWSIWLSAHLLSNPMDASYLNNSCYKLTRSKKWRWWQQNMGSIVTSSHVLAFHQSGVAPLVPPTFDRMSTPFTPFTPLCSQMLGGEDTSINKQTSPLAKGTSRIQCKCTSPIECWSWCKQEDKSGRFPTSGSQVFFYS